MKKAKQKFDELGKIPGAKIGSMLRIRLPNDYVVSPSGIDKVMLKKWCVEQAHHITIDDDTVHIINSAEKLYDWVSK